MEPLIRVDDIDWFPQEANGALKSLEQVMFRLQEHGDSRAVFLDVYVIITRHVVELLKTEHKGGFLEPQWLSHLTGLFAADALVAVRQSLLGEPIRSAAWRFGTYYPANKLTLPYQDAILGISAHINHDLALVVYDNLASQRAVDAARLERYRHDFMHVNEILFTCMPACINMLVERYDCPFTRAVLRVPMSRPIIERIVFKTLVVWRNRVWDDVMALLNARDAEARQDILTRIDRTSGRIAQGIVANSAMRVLLQGQSVPFTLARAAEYWPGVGDGGAQGYGISRKAA
jgi:hypothetical protein